MRLAERPCVRSLRCSSSACLVLGVLRRDTCSSAALLFARRRERMESALAGAATAAAIERPAGGAEGLWVLRVLCLSARCVALGLMACV